MTFLGLLIGFLVYSFYSTSWSFKKVKDKYLSSKGDIVEISSLYVDLISKSKFYLHVNDKSVRIETANGFVSIKEEQLKEVSDSLNLNDIAMQKLVNLMVKNEIRTVSYELTNNTVKSVNIRMGKGFFGYHTYWLLICKSKDCKANSEKSKLEKIEEGVYYLEILF